MNTIRRLALILPLSFFILFSARSEVNVRLSPLHLLIGMLHVEADFGVSEAWTLGPQLQYMNHNSDGFDVRAYGVGIRGNYYFNGAVFTQGWYFGPSVQYINVKIRDDNDSYGDMKGSASGVAVTSLMGYQWMWESFNINLGLGPVYYSIGDVVVENDDGSDKRHYAGYDGLGLALEFTMGWKF